MEEAWSGVRLSMAYSKLTLPLPKGYFADVLVSSEQVHEYRELVRQRLHAVLADEKCCKQRHTNGLPPLDPWNWRCVQSLDGLQVFSRRQRGRSTAELASEEDIPQAMRAVSNGQPSIMTVGSIAGTIEDVLYGFAGTTDEEIRTSMSFLARKTDATILSNIELATEEDPLHYLGLKWLYCSKAMCAPRDLCCLQATGVQIDCSGKKYGYLMLHSVDLPECPPFDRKSHIVRGRLFFTCILRETTPGFVDVLARGIFDMSSDGRRATMSSLKRTPCIAAFMGALRKLVDCADAKKLTLLARRTVARVDVGESFRRLPPPPKKAVCVVCIKRDGSDLFHSVHLRVCRICGMPICSKCSLDNKRVFLGCRRPWAVVPCCPACALEAHRMTSVHPSEPEFAVVSDYFQPKNSGVSAATRSTSTFTLPSFLNGCPGHLVPNTVAGKDHPGVESTIGLSATEGKIVRESDLFSDVSDLGMSPSDVGIEDSSHGEARVMDTTFDTEAGSEPLPAVVEELLNTTTDNHREQNELSELYLQEPIDTSATQSRTTIGDFRQDVGNTMTNCEKLMTTASARGRNKSDGAGIPLPQCKEFAAKLQELQSTADRIYGEVVTQRKESQ